ncbi:SUMF1/EgtB/PvdO family nonheme iron enzyme [Geothrix sp. PMB-07]|uniref:formylglycine-generating enzyme family protein n=1 Tax=Geothrix sp. PMB-07 TaxID=3068640 RepID=UPI002740CAE4|nr:SUMF1/EgtB/PvdO family nonheme iron enzyme [Geothrix sp. PMB-07]WLT30232.1 SUMF1/EgtB/PvdO family nonheme iron enzyme [Geothrix sp. PMB-07]
MSLAVLAPPLSIRSGPATLRSRFAQAFLGVSALILALACGGGGGGGGGSTTPVVPPPVATSLTASAAAPAFGSTFTLTPVYTAGTGAIDNGVTCPATGVPSAAITANWAGAKTFTLTVTNSANVTATTTAVVTPQVVSVGAITPAAPSVTVSTTKTFSSTVTGGALNTVTWSASAGSFAGNVWTAPATPGTVTITATSVDDPTKTATTTVTVLAAVAVPTTPVVTAPAKATAGKTGLTASVPTQAGCTYAWTQTGGATITAGATTNSITWTAPASGSVTLSCTVTNSAGVSATPGTATIPVVAAATQPVVTAPASVTASKTGLTASVPAQTGCTYAWTQTGGATITAGATTNSITWTAPASGSVVLSCTVTNSAGDAATAGTHTSAVVAAATQPTVTAPANVTASKTGLTASVPTQSGCTYAWSQTGGATITAGATTNSITWTAPASGSVVLSCTVTNAAGDAATAGTHTSAVVPLPSITSFSATASRVVPSGSTTLIANFTGGTGSVSGLGAIVGDGTPLSTNALSTTTVFTLTVTNAAGDAAVSHPTATVTVGNDLTVNITGLGALAGDVTVTGPNGFNQHLTANQTFNGLEDGTYTITAATVTDLSQPGLGGALGSAHLQRYPLVRVQTQALSAAGSDPATATLVANYPAATLTVAAGSTSIDMVLVPGGTYTMGESETTIGSEAVALPPHSVTLAKAFYVAKVPVTQAQWSALMSGNNPSDFVGPTFPVTNVSFDDITAPTTGFLDSLNAAASAKPTGSTFRLPTDAEFEYATRAGTTTNFYFGSYDTGVPADQSVVDTFVWSNSNSAGAIHPVGALLPNAWGLYDMSGLIWQLCQDDWHADYAASGPGIPALPVNGSAWVDSPRAAGRVYRGGSWAGAPWQAQSKFRGPYNHNDALNNNAGFRVVLQLP